MGAKRLLLALGVLFTSLSVLTLEITLTRIASVVMYYHFSFLVVSLGLLGLGISGIYVFLAGQRFSSEQFGKHAPIACLLFAVTAMISVGILLSMRLNLTVSWTWLTSLDGLLAVLTIMLLVVPFFFGGIALSLVLKHYSSQVSWLYFADLVGGGLGCLLIVPTLDWLGGFGAITLVSLLASVAALSFALVGSVRRFVPVSIVVGVLLLATGMANSQLGWVRVRFPKGEVETTPVYEKWNAFSRVAVYPPNLLSKNFELWDPGKNIPVDRMGIDIDAGAFTSMVKFDGDLSKVDYLKTDIAAVPYRVTPNNNVLIIGSGGGQDVLIALLFGSRRVTAVEMNPIMFSIVDDRFGQFSGRIYQRPEVVAVTDEARSYIRHSKERYDIIQATLVDTFAASAAGAYALSENYLYTEEAFGDYWDHLTDNGMLAMTRWYQDPPNEVSRLITLSLAVMRQRGIPDPEQHIVITRQDFRSTFLLKRSKFTTSDLAALDQGAEGSYEIIYAPGMTSNSPFAQAIAQFGAVIRDNPQDISAPTDDRPFFFYYIKPADNPFATIINMAKGVNEPSTILLFLFFLLLLLTFIFILVPLNIFASTSAGRHPSALIYFACLGVGFILIEIALVQRFILFLGHPIYAIAVILFSLLFFGGIGSSLSGLFKEKDRLKLHLMVLGILVLILVIYGLALSWFINTFIGLDTVSRIGLTIVALCPLGLFMGMQFPLGISAVSRSVPLLVPWLWGINGMFSVIGSVSAAILAINFGLDATFRLGVIAYGVALVIILWHAFGHPATTFGTVADV
jgi:hypothetical protein